MLALPKLSHISRLSPFLLILKAGDRVGRHEPENQRQRIVINVIIGRCLIWPGLSRRLGYQAVEEWDRYIRQTALNIPLSALLRIRPRVRRDKLQIFYHIWYFWKITSTETILICIIRISGNCNWIAMWFSDYFPKFHLLWIAPLCTGTLWPAPTRTAPRGATTSHSRGSTFPSPRVATFIVTTAAFSSLQTMEISKIAENAKVGSTISLN